MYVFMYLCMSVSASMQARHSCKCTQGVHASSKCRQGGGVCRGARGAARGGLLRRRIARRPEGSAHARLTVDQRIGDLGYSRYTSSTCRHGRPRRWTSSSPTLAAEVSRRLTQAIWASHSSTLQCLQLQSRVGLVEIPLCCVLRPLPRVHEQAAAGKLRTCGR